MASVSQVSTITSTDVSAKDLVDRFETQAKLKGIRVHTSSRFSAGAQPDTIERKVQLVSAKNWVFLCVDDLRALLLFVSSFFLYFSFHFMRPLFLLFL